MLKRNKINDLIEPIDGIFASIDSTIFDDMDALTLDMEFYTKYGEKYGNMLFDYYTNADGVVDKEQLGNLLLNKYEMKWSRIISAFALEYDLSITSTNDVITERVDINTGTENSQSTGTQTGDVTTDDTGSETLSKLGQETTTGNNSTMYGRSDTRTPNLTTTDTGELLKTGSEKHDSTTTNEYGRTDTRTPDITTTDTGDVTKSGSEKNVSSGTDKYDTTDKTTDSGTETLTKSGTIGNNGGTDSKRNTFGSAGQTNVSSEDTNNSETIDTTDENKLNTTHTTTKTGTVDNDTTNTLTFTGRKDATKNTQTVAGTEKNQASGADSVDVSDTLTFASRKDTTTNSNQITGTEKNQASGSDTVTRTDTLGFTDRQDEMVRSGNSTVTNNLQDTSDTTVTNDNKNLFYEKVSSAGSSPLRTFQALIMEEIDVVSINLYDIMAKDLDELIGSGIWADTNKKYGGLK